MIQRFFSAVICAAFLTALLVGCASTRTMSFPKMNWAWWKKKDGPTGRHDEAIAAPSATMSPVNSLVKSDGKESLAPATEKTRKPYDTGITPPEPKSFAPMANPANAALAGSTKSPSDQALSNKAAPPTTDLPGAVAGSSSPLGASSPLGNSSPLGASAPPSAESTLAKSLQNSPRKSFELSPPSSPDQTLKIQGSNTYLPGQSSAVADRGSSALSQGGSAPRTQMQANPYASGGITGATASAPAPTNSPLMPVPKSPPTAGESSPSYARTQYNEFVPKNPGAQANSLPASSPLSPLQPKSTMPPENANAAIGSSMAPPPSGQQAVAQVSYTPGSIGSSRSLSELLAAAPAATTNATANLANSLGSPTTNAPAAAATNPATESAPTNSATRIGGGGAFRIVK